jgi:outer membrane protein OmpA-like peptidoglycan-associated protein
MDLCILRGGRLRYMGDPIRPRRGRVWRSRRAVPITDAVDAEKRRRLVGLALFIALLLVGGVVGIIRASSAHHSAAAPVHPGTTPGPLTYGLVGGGGVAPRAATGKLAMADSVGQILFAEDGTALDTYALTVIDNAARAIRAHHPAAVIITGYTDAIGNAGANRRLSLLRARTVLRALRLRLGSAALRYYTRARGQTQPVASNSTAAGRQLNRRVIITVSR